jgi:hypothetical protein
MNPTSRWVLDDTDGHSDKNQESLNGMQFAETIQSIAKGEFSLSHPKRVYPARKKIFWEENRYNPLILTSQISHEHEAHQIEQEKYWKKSGKKFSGEPRFPPKIKRIGDGVLESGLLFPAEIPQFNEKKVEYFERTVTPLKFKRLPKKESASRKDILVNF